MPHAVIELRDVREEDLPVFFEHQSDPVAYRLAAFTPRDHDAFMTHWKDNVLGDPGATTKTVVHNGNVAGFVVSFDRAGIREIGYWIGREYWGKGIASEALVRFLEVATERPLHAVVAKSNGASLRVLEKCGFQIDGESEASPGQDEPAVDDWILKLE